MRLARNTDFGKSRLALVAALACCLLALTVAATGAVAADHQPAAAHAEQGKRKKGTHKRKRRAHNHHVRHVRGKARAKIPVAVRQSMPKHSSSIATAAAVEEPKDASSSRAPAKPRPAPSPAPASTPTPSPAPAPVPTPTAAMAESGFEEGLRGWNTAGVGEVVPTTESWNAREGNAACLVTLTGSLGRSELIFGGNGSGSTAGMFEFEDGDEYWYGFSIDVLQMTYGRPGAHNLFMQFKSEGEGSPNFGLQLWDWEGKKGLWSHSEAMGGDRYLAPLSEDVWHEILIHFRASNDNTGFYELFLDGQLIDLRANVSMIVPGARHAYIKDGLYRNGGTNPGTSEILLDAARLGSSRNAVIAR